MSEFDDVAIIWGENVSLPHQPAEPPSVGVAMWASVLGNTWYRWRDGEMPDLSQYRVALVNAFHTNDFHHIQQIRERYPDMLIVGMPDANLELTLANPEWINLWQQLSFCDVIAGRTQQDCDVYSAFFDKPAVWLPSPIYPLEHFAAFRDTPKEDFILTQDHIMHDGLFAQNVAALALIQRETGLRVVYAAARPQTEWYARLAGLDAEFTGHIPFPDFVALTARAKLCVDMYLRHSYHRQAVLCAAVGTVMVGSDYSLYTGHVQVDPLDPQTALARTKMLLENPGVYRYYQELGYKVVEDSYGVGACRRRVRQLISEYAKERA